MGLLSFLARRSDVPEPVKRWGVSHAQHNEALERAAAGHQAIIEKLRGELRAAMDTARSVATTAEARIEAARECAAMREASAAKLAERWGPVCPPDTYAPLGWAPKTH